MSLKIVALTFEVPVGKFCNGCDHCRPDLTKAVDINGYEMHYCDLLKDTMPQQLWSKTLRIYKHNACLDADEV